MVKSYHGIVINLSQKDRGILEAYKIIGRKNVIPGFLCLEKIEISQGEIEKAIVVLQNNLRDKLWPIIKAFYLHLYRENELIVIFKKRIFRVSPDPKSWNEAIAYGLGLGIPKKQLDFFPCKFEDENY
jgi:hypothetical protein